MQILPHRALQGGLQDHLQLLKQTWLTTVRPLQKQTKKSQKNALDSGEVIKLCAL